MLEIRAPCEVNRITMTKRLISFSLARRGGGWMVGFKGGEENDQGGGSKIVMAKGNEEKFREDPGGYRVTVDEER